MFLFAALIFFTSGVPALVYQITWQRILALHSGVGIYSVAMIVAAFMAGLGIGSELGGRLSQRFGPSGALWGFALIELSIGGFALLSPWLYYDVLYERFGWLYERPWLAGVCHFGALLLPTGLMGMSLPMLVRAMVLDSAHACRTIGYLYAVNGLGAAVGALLTPWVLIPRWGIAGAIYAAVMLNLAAGLGAFVVYYLFARQTIQAAGSSKKIVQGFAAEAGQARASMAEPPASLATWALLYATSGFCALGLEMVWFRLIDVGVKSTAFTFGTVLFIFLTGLSLGSFVGARFESRWQRPRQLFLIVQMLIAGYTALVVLTLVWLPTETPIFSTLFDYWRNYEPYTPRTIAARHAGYYLPVLLYVVLPVFLLFVPTTLMGLSFTLVQRAVHDDPQTTGRKVGLLQAANIVGGVLGSLFVGLIAIELWGSAGTLRLLVGMALVFAIVGLFGRVRLPFVLGGVALVILLAMLPDQDRLWRRLHGLRDEPAWFGEDASGLAAITPELGGYADWRVSVNGKGHSVLPYGALHSNLGTLPAVIHPSPADVAIIGLGSGDTPWAVACRPETKRVDVFEICAPEQDLLEQLNETVALPQLRRLLADSRIRVIPADGRNALRSGEERYDIIEADASRPDSAYGGNLFSEEFFRECSARLKPGGLMVTWSPTPRVYATFCRVFPHVLALGTVQLIGSNEPLPIDMPQWRQHLTQPEVAEYLGDRIVQYSLRTLETISPAAPQSISAEAMASNFDLFPRDEFHQPSSLTEALMMRDLGELALGHGETEVAIAAMQDALRLAPDLPLALAHLGVTYARQGNLLEAERKLKESLRVAPEYHEPAYHLAQLYLAQGRVAEALPLLQLVSQTFLANPEVATKYALALNAAGDSRGALQWYERALELNPQRSDALQGIAWLLATDGDATLRNPGRALGYAQQALQGLSDEQASVLDILAAAQAANGDYPRAISTAERAQRLAEQRRETALRQAILSRLSLYRAGRPFVQAPSARPAANATSG
ncbi:MAG: fused MFS/spermidine synthase [Pirellulales bacterium]|nr:fused MFS/spermidine synthase [Pirellulales bacterium]